MSRNLVSGRWPGGLISPISAALVTLAVVATPSAFAQDADPALSPAASKRAANVEPARARSVAVSPQQWEALQRPADRMGPPPLRSADAALLAAARNQRWREALTLVKAGANPSARDAAGGCVVALAARDGQEELLRELLARGADANCSSEHGFTALGAAAFEGRVGTVRALLLQGADATRWGATGLAPLHLAALTGQVGVLQELLKAQQRGLSVDLLSRQRETALDLAAAAGHGDAMDLLIARGADLAQAGRR